MAQGNAGFGFQGAMRRGLTSMGPLLAGVGPSWERDLSLLVMEGWLGSL